MGGTVLRPTQQHAASTHRLKPITLLSYYYIIFYYINSIYYRYRSDSLKYIYIYISVRRGCIVHWEKMLRIAAGQADHRLGGWPALQQWKSMQIIIYALWTLVDIRTQGTMCLLLCLVGLVCWDWP